jgi:hypothetical protein
MNNGSKESKALFPLVSIFVPLTVYLNPFTYATEYLEILHRTYTNYMINNTKPYISPSLNCTDLYKFIINYVISLLQMICLKNVRGTVKKQVNVSHICVTKETALSVITSQ